MHPGLGDVAGDVEANPRAVFEAHDADSVDELVAAGSVPEREPSCDSGVARLFEGGLDRPERTADPERDRGAEQTESGTEEPAGPTASAVLDELEETVTADGEATTAGPDDRDAIDDGDVEDALAAAEAIDDADAESVPAEWQDR